MNVEKQNSEWLAMRKIVHRRARIELDRLYMRRLKKLRKLQSKIDLEEVKSNEKKN